MRIKISTNTGPLIIEECLEPYYAFYDSNTCTCCDGFGMHTWSPAYYFNGAFGPDSGEYQCEPCKGVGHYE